MWQRQQPFIAAPINLIINAFISGTTHNTEIDRDAVLVVFTRDSIVHGGPNMAQFMLNALTLSNINRFSKFFHCQNLENICNNITRSHGSVRVL